MGIGLTAAEHALVDKLGECASDFASICKEARGSDLDQWGAFEQDTREFAAHVHDLQNAVLANAAARAYPDRYRLAGGPSVKAVRRA